MAESQLQMYADAMLNQLGDVSSIPIEDTSIKVVGVPFKKNMATIDGGDFELMIQLEEFSDCLFIFNGNQKCDNEQAPKAGGGSAVIRPYSTSEYSYRALPIPTGWAAGIPFKTIRDDQVRMAIDDSFQRICTVLNKFGYKRILFPCASEHERKSLGCGIFDVPDDVLAYINNKLNSFSHNFEKIKLFVPIAYIDSRKKYYTFRINDEIEKLKSSRAARKNQVDGFNPVGTFKRVNGGISPEQSVFANKFSRHHIDSRRISGSFAE